VSGSEQPSRAELCALIEAQARTIEQLQAEVAELKRRLGRISGDSSQPPSADGPAVSPLRAARRRSGRSTGKQPGAGGSALFPTSNPNEIVDHLPDACGGCGGDLSGATAAGWCVARSTTSPPP
jgi:transposase